MIHFYTNRELSRRLEINLARWKRWSRSFLPPDPLGGMQSGYARQYSYKEVCKVYLGGFLLSHLKMSVPESQEVLADLSPWLKKNGFFDMNGPNDGKVSPHIPSAVHRLYISRNQATHNKAAGFSYLIRYSVDRPDPNSEDDRIITDIIRDQLLNAGAVDGIAFLKDPFVLLVNLTPLFESMKRRLVGF
ncbi:MAG: hypothetical protein CR984_06610 [Proteobacteria bacterium]|nr:MAG: hypothetical protein CR984_06610 [Pseudomonadota bacterium]PIE68130.1 MAG: hypothetical protein CSA23_00495 [Deltaproteobacteria bacterium]